MHTMFQKFLDRPFVSAALVLGVSVVLAAAFVAQTLYAVRSLDNTFTSTGSAKEKVTANSAKWSSQVARTVTEAAIPSAYTAVEKDMEVVKAHFKSQGITDDQMRVTPIFVNQDYGYNTDPNAPRKFSVTQSITIESADVDKVRMLAEGAGALIQKGVMFSPGMPEYYVTNLPELRVALLGKAVEDARARVSEIAESSDQRVGKLKSASSGVVQILSPGSIEVSDYGSYDTSTIEKEVMVTVRATFFVR